MNDKPNKLSASLEVNLENSITSDALSSLSLDSAEIVFDTVLEDGILKDIPVFGSLYKLAQIGIGIKDQIFAKKVYNFLFEIKDISVKKRERFMNELQNECGVQQTAGEVLLMLIDRFDNSKKPIILANLLKAKISGNINLNDFLRLGSIVDRAFMQDLNILHLYASDRRYDKNISEGLSFLGLITHDNSQSGITYSVIKSGEYNISTIGKDLLEYGLNPT